MSVSGKEMFAKKRSRIKELDLEYGLSTTKGKLLSTTLRVSLDKRLFSYWLHIPTMTGPRRFVFG